MTHEPGRTRWALTIVGCFAAFAVVAIVGLATLPQATVVWIVLLVFAMTAVPQVLLRRRARGADEGERDP